MRNLSLVVAALALMLAGPLATIARADNTEHDSRIDRSDLGVGAPPAAEQQAKGVPGSTGIYDNYDRFRDPQGFPQPGWQNLFNFPG